MSVERQLARVEVRQLLRNPLVWLSLVPSAAWLWGAWRDEADTAAPDRYVLLVGFGLVLPAFGLAVATAFSVLRDRRSGTASLLHVLPVGEDRRSVAFGWAALAAVVFGAVLIAVTWLAFRPGTRLGQTESTSPLPVDIPHPSAAQLVQGPLALGLVVTFVVAMVRWVPSWLILAPLAFAVMIQGLFFGIFEGVPTGPASWLAPLSTGSVRGSWLGCTEGDVRCDLEQSGFDLTTPWWHAAYLVAAAATCVTIAVLRHRRDRRTWLAFGLATGALVATALVQVVVFERYVPPGAA